MPSAAETYAVYTDSITLPEEESAVMADMIGCLVYQGKVYTQGEALWGDEPGENDALLGEYVGEAKGTLSEWATQEDWAAEFASTYAGPVYTVNGYDPSFRLCLVQRTDGEPCGAFSVTFPAGEGTDHLPGLVEKRRTR